MNHSDSESHRIFRGLYFDGFSFKNNLAFVAACLSNYAHTEKDVHQRGFSRAVFTCQSNYLSRINFKVDAIQNYIS